MPTLPDDLLLLLLDADTGRPRVERTKLDYGLAGAVLLDLALAGRVHAEPRSPRRADVSVLEAAATGDEVLDDALRRIGPRSVRADKLVPALSKGLRRRLLARAERAGRLRRERDRLLGVFPRDRWPAADDRQRELAGRLSDVLVVGATPDPRTAALVAVLAAIDAAHLVVGVRDRAGRAAVRRRAQEVGEGAWAAEAVRKAVAAVQAAVAASTTAAVTAATVASS